MLAAGKITKATKVELIWHNDGYHADMGNNGPKIYSAIDTENSSVEQYKSFFCDKNAVCSGSTCTCDKGLTGDGKTCSGPCQSQ